MKLGPEDIQSIIFYDWVRYNNLDHIVYHVANERTCSNYTGSIFKRKGVKAGVLDYDVKRASQGYHGLLIELKVKPNKPSKLQLQFIEDMTKEGYLCAVCYSAEEAKKAVSDYLHISST